MRIFPSFSKEKLDNMDYREYWFWLEESIKQSLLKKQEAMEIALLPHQKPENIRKVLSKVRYDLMRIEKADEIQNSIRRTKKKMKIYEELKKNKKWIKKK